MPRDRVHPLRRRRERGQRPRDGEVPGRDDRRVQHRGQRVPDADVQEPDVATGARLDQPKPARLVQRVVHLLGRQAQHGDEHVGRELRAGHGGGGQHVDGAGVQRVQPGQQQPQGVLGQVERVQAGLVEHPAAPVGAHQPGVGDRPQVLVHHERVALAPGHQPPHEGVVGSRPGQQRQHQVGDGVGRQRAQREVHVDARAERFRGVVAAGHHQQHGRAREIAGELGQHAPGRVVQPLRVVHHEQQAAAGGRERGQERRDDDGELLVAVVVHGAGRAEHGGQVRGQRGQGRRGAAGARANSLVRLHWQSAEMPFERAAQRRHRDRVVRGSVGVEDRPTGLSHQFADQPRLARAAAAAHGHGATGAPARGVPPGPQPLQLIRPANQRLPGRLAIPPGRRAADGHEVGDEIGAGLVPVVRLLGQQSGDDRSQVRRRVGRETQQVRRGLDGVHAQQVADVGRGERRPAGEALVQHHAERVQVGSLVHRAAQRARLLRRRVQQRADGRLGALVRLARRHAEVDQAGPAVGLDHDVVRLDVAVHQPGPVDRRQRIREFQRQRHDPVGGQRPVVQQAGQRPTLDEIHHEVRAPVVPSDLVDPHEVGMVHGGQQRRLAAQCDGRLIGRPIDHLERVGAAVRRPLDAQHRRVRPAPEFGHHHVPGEPVDLRRDGSPGFTVHVVPSAARDAT